MSLVKVEGAELVAGRIHWGAATEAENPGFWGKAWRFLSPEPLQLQPGERFLLATRMHWCVPLKEIAQSAVTMPAAVLASVLIDWLANSVWWLQVVVWATAIIHQVHVGLKVMTWRAHLLVVTNRRLVRTYGVFSSVIDSRNLNRITDWQIRQSFIGRIFGVGELLIESAGRHDVSSSRERIRFVPNPSAVYRAAHSWEN